MIGVLNNSILYLIVFFVFIIILIKLLKKMVSFKHSIISTCLLTFWSVFIDPIFCIIEIVRY